MIFSSVQCTNTYIYTNAQGPFQNSSSPFFQQSAGGSKCFPRESEDGCFFKILYFVTKLGSPGCVQAGSRQEVGASYRNHLHASKPPPPPSRPSPQLPRLSTLLLGTMCIQTKDTEICKQILACVRISTQFNKVITLNKFRISTEFFLLASPCRGSESQDVCGTFQFNFTNCARCHIR